MKGEKAIQITGGVLVGVILVLYVLPALAGLLCGFVMWMWRAVQLSFAGGFHLLAPDIKPTDGLGWARWLILAALAIALACLALQVIAWTVDRLFAFFREKQAGLLALLFGAGATLLAKLCEDYLPDDNKVLKRLLSTTTMLVFAGTAVLQTKPQKAWKIMALAINIIYPLFFLFVATGGKFAADITEVKQPVWWFVVVWVSGFVVVALLNKRESKRTSIDNIV